MFGDSPLVYPRVMANAEPVVAEAEAQAGIDDAEMEAAFSHLLQHRPQPRRMPPLGRVENWNSYNIFRFAVRSSARLSAVHNFYKMKTQNDLLKIHGL